MHEQKKTDQQNHKACTKSSPQLTVENPGKWQEGPRQIARLVQDGPPQLMVENPGKWREGPQQITRLVQDGPTQLMVENPGKWWEGPQQITRLVQDGPPQLMVENPGKWREGPQQITRLVQDGPSQLMVENPGKWREGPQWFLRTTNKNGSFRSHQILKKKMPITSSFIIVSCPWFLLFCFVLYHQSWGSTYTRAFKNIIVFGLKNRGWLIHKSTYTRENTVPVFKCKNNVCI